MGEIGEPHYPAARRTAAVQVSVWPLGSAGKEGELDGVFEVRSIMGSCRSGAPRARRIRHDHVRAQHVQREHRQQGRGAGGSGLGARLRRHRAAACRDVGVPHRQHVRRGRVLVIRRLLDLVLGVGDVLREGHPGGPCRNRDRPLSVGLGDLHHLHVRRLAPDHGAVALVFFLLSITFILLGAGNSGGNTTSSTGAATSASPQQRRPGTRRSPPSSTRRSAGPSRPSCRFRCPGEEVDPAGR